MDQKGLLKAYLADMSQNVNSAIMKVHKHQYKVAQGPKHIIENDGEGDISTWNQFQTSIPDIKEQHENPFDGRKIGISKKVQEEMALKDSQWWTGSKKCPGCGDGFTKQSSVTNCTGCNLFVHKRRTCLRKTEEGNLICGKCRPITKNNIVTEKVENFVCNVCNKTFSKKSTLLDM